MTVPQSIEIHVYLFKMKGFWRHFSEKIFNNSFYLDFILRVSP